MLPRLLGDMPCALHRGVASFASSYIGSVITRLGSFVHRVIVRYVGFSGCAATQHKPTILHPAHELTFGKPRAFVGELALLAARNVMDEMCLNNACVFWCAATLLHRPCKAPSNAR